MTPAFKSLSSEKASQEIEVLQRFAALYQSGNAGSTITNITAGPERGHDATFSLDGRQVEVEITELIDRTFVYPMTRDEYDACQWVDAILLPGNPIPARVDRKARDESLRDSIEKKILRHYTKPPMHDLWLLVFSVAPGYFARVSEAGSMRASTAMTLAQSRIAEIGPGPFAAIWFTDLETNPVRIWPVDP